MNASPVLSVWTEEVASVRRVQDLLVNANLESVESTASAAKVPLLVRKSPTILVVSVQAHESADVAILADGQSLAVARFGNVTTARLPLNGDIERHLVSIIVDGVWIGILDVRVEVWRAIGADNGALLFYAPKWTRSDVEIALTSYDAWTGERSSKRSGLDPVTTGLARSGALNEGDTVQALHFEAHRLARHVSSLRAPDLLDDYAYEEDPELDVEGTLEALRRHPSWLVPKAEGSIAFKGRRYSTSAVSWRKQSIGRLDLTVPMHVTSAAIEAAEADPQCQGAALILRSLLRRLTRLNSARRGRPSTTMINVWLSKEVRNSRARILRDLLLRVFALATRQSARTTVFGTTEGLGLGSRDFDLFQWWCGRCICTAFDVELPRDQTVCSIDAGLHTIYFPDRAGGREAIAGILSGWRDGSDQQSEYRPDFVIHYEGANPIIIDAKFRSASSIASPASPSSFKEVQAYLDEFGANGAIILVPSIPKRFAVPQEDVSPWLIEGQSNGGWKKIFVVECTPDRDPSIPIRTAVEALAAS